MSEYRLSVVGTSFGALFTAKLGSLRIVDSATFDSDTAVAPQVFDLFETISALFLSSQLPSALCAPLVAVNPCLDSTDADYRCELDEFGEL